VHVAQSPITPSYRWDLDRVQPATRSSPSKQQQRLDRHRPAISSRRCVHSQCRASRSPAPAQAKRHQPIRCPCRERRTVRDGAGVDSKAPSRDSGTRESTRPMMSPGPSDRGTGGCSGRSKLHGDLGSGAAIRLRAPFRRISPAWVLSRGQAVEKSSSCPRRSAMML